jgi:glycosyltransferase involved in cell wall biosynthesis
VLTQRSLGVAKFWSSLAKPRDLGAATPSPSLPRSQRIITRQEPQPGPRSLRDRTLPFASMQPLRVAYVAVDRGLRLDQIGGAGTHMRGTIAALESQRIKVEALVGPARGTAQRAEPSTTLKGRIKPLLPRRLALVARDVAIRRHGRLVPEFEGPCDCVYERSTYLSDSGRRLASRFGVPYVLESDGLLVDAWRETWGSGLARHAERIERRKLKGADLVAVMARAAVQPLVEKYGIDEAGVFVKGLGVEQELIDRAVSPPPEELRIGFAGTFQPYHGADLLVSALRHLARARAHATFIGNGPTYESTRRLAVGLSCTFTGELSRREMLARLSQSRVLVIPDSAPSMYPIKVLEYATLGRAIVCPDYPAYDEFAIGGMSLVYRFKPGSARSLAEVLLHAMDDRLLPERVSTLRRLVANEYSWAAVGSRLAARLRVITGNRRCPCPGHTDRFASNRNQD